MIALARSLQSHKASRLKIAAIGDRKINVRLKAIGHLLQFVASTLLVTGISGCLLETETAITPDPKVDSRLEGVWQITPKQPGEVRNNRDEDDVGVNGYIIMAPLKNSDGSIDPTTYKALAIDSFGREDASNDFPEMFVSTRKHDGHDFLLVRLADSEKKKLKKGEASFKNWVLDYEFDKEGALFLRWWSVEDFDELQKLHPMKFDHMDKPFAPTTLKGDEAQLLSYYGDPKVRAMLGSLGKYRKLVTPKVAARKSVPSEGDKSSK